jgi:1-hydroxycarotenoid 3,4-desaturase
MRSSRIVIIGAGMGGLSAAVELLAEGFDVLILERAAVAGGKLHQLKAGGKAIDAGPTVFTMRPIFEALFARAGADIADHLTLRQASVLARHGWGDGGRLDLFADVERSAEAIAALSGAHDAAGYLRFVKDARKIYETLEGPFIHSDKPSLPGLIGSVAATKPRNLWSIQPYSSLWKKLGSYFRDPRLRQLFARYSTYCGSSPFEAPATLMLIAHVEQCGVWLVEGGMQHIAEALTGLIAARGGEIRYGAEVAEILVKDGEAGGVRLAGGEVIEADAVVCNADVNAVATGLLGRGAMGAADPVPPKRRSLSAVTFAMTAPASGFPLARHTVFFSPDYPAEFEDILRGRRTPRQPTVYVCAQDRGDDGSGAPRPGEGEGERLLLIVNAPPIGDQKIFSQKEIEQCAASAFATLSRCGLRIEPRPELMAAATPTDFNGMFPATGGALYGLASHGWQASFQRAKARSRIARLYFAGGSVHPGSGLPMAALSGRLAGRAVSAELASARRFHPVVMPGGMSTA